MTYKEAEEYLYTRLPMYQRIGAPALKPNLDNTYKLLEAIKNPHEALKTVHIAGTNGKGSSAHSIASVLQAAGYKTGLYTSPHLKNFTERIKIDGVEVVQNFVTDFVEKNQVLIERVAPSFFELTVAMAFDYFRKEAVDIAIIEVGLGGRLDSTNVIRPEVSLITMIGWDHANLLGNTLSKIASEKAGIIKSGIPVVIGANQLELLQVFSEKAEEEKAPLYLTHEITLRELKNEIPSHYEVKINEQSLDISFDILGSFYLKNVPGIIKTLLLLREKGWVIPDQAIKIGLENVTKSTGLKGRWQVLNQLPLTIADVGHNQDGLQELFDQVSKKPHNHLHLIYGTVEDKDVEKILSLFPKTNTSFYFTTASIARAMPLMKLYQTAKNYGLDGGTFANVNIALLAAKKVANKEDIILVCGSTFVVAEIDDL
ncbi:MAG: Mur ligase family protein [Cyclobacteriaceae bacterium]